MNEAHLHLVINHFPIVGLVLGLLVIGMGFLLKNKTIKQTALGILIFSAITTIPAFYTGEGAEEIIEKYPGISETLIHTHEENAELFLTMMLILGGLSIITLFADLKKYNISKYLYPLVLILTLACGFVAKNVGTSGGEIRHTEIRLGDQVIGVDSNKDLKGDDDDDY